MPTTTTPETILPAGPKHTPWAVQVVVEKRRKGEQKILRVEPVHKPRKTPWERSPPPTRSREPSPPAIHLPEPETRHGPPRWREPSPPPEEPKPLSTARSPPRQKGVRLVSAQNYAAIEAGQERYGLIDSGAPDSGRTRSLIMHVRKNRVPFQVLNYVRPGSVLHVRRPSKGKRTATAQLRVRFTTPARYYSPGCPVTTLALEVDGADWQGLMTGTPRI
jgi:hypothetical protein